MSLKKRGPLMPFRQVSQPRSPLPDSTKVPCFYKTFLNSVVFNRLYAENSKHHELPIPDLQKPLIHQQ